MRPTGWAADSMEVENWNLCGADSRLVQGRIHQTLPMPVNPNGSIQVPSGTEPIILHRDAVSGGGYFMIGTIISADLDLIGQMQQNTPTRFLDVDLNALLEARESRNSILAELRELLA